MQFSVKKSEVFVFILFFSLFSALGVWQLKRADEKRDIEKLINARSADAALVLSGPVDWDAENIQYQNIKVRGEFVPKGQLLIDNILRAGAPGYHVVTPFRIVDTDLHILVNRGWVAQGKSRQHLPVLTLPQGLLTLEGIVRTPSALPFVDSSIEALVPDESLNLWLYIDLQKYQAESPLKMIAFAMLQNSDTGDGLLREWPVYKAKVAMHIGYAIQWFAFAIIVSLIFIGIGRKHGKKAVQTGEEATTN